MAKTLVGVGIVAGVVSGGIFEQQDGTLLTSVIPLVFVGPLLILTGSASLVRDRVVSRAAASSASSLRLQAGGWTFVVLAASVAPWTVGGAIGLARLNSTGCGHQNCGLPSFLLIAFAAVVAVVTALLGGGILLLARRMAREAADQEAAGTLETPRHTSPTEG